MTPKEKAIKYLEEKKSFLLTDSDSEYHIEQAINIALKERDKEWLKSIQECEIGIQDEKYKIGINFAFSTLKLKMKMC